jgi:hypothetical protein
MRHLLTWYFANVSRVVAALGCASLQALVLGLTATITLGTFFVQIAIDIFLLSRLWCSLFPEFPKRTCSSVLVGNFPNFPALYYLH